ncbi:hypothetical protein [Povalibacter sp.]|uniref:hypothetical protein n=1 Tax=Povalibacter sp. TaxID=1962978 RepID=UPI002F3EFB56
MATISGLWIGARLSPLERSCIASFLGRGHQFDLYVYEPVADVPDGCRLADAATTLPARRVFAHSQGEGRGSVAAFSDLFRYELLMRRGGWWADLDVFCLGDRLPDEDTVIGRQGQTVVNGAVLRFPPAHPLIAAAREACETAAADCAWGEIGPDLLTRLVREHDLQSRVQPPAVFYPVDWQHYWAVLDPRRSADVLRRMQGAVCIHLWNEMLRRIRFDKFVLPPPGSVLRMLYEATLAVGAFDREYVLAEQSPPEALHLEVRARQ